MSSIDPKNSGQHPALPQSVVPPTPQEVESLRGFIGRSCGLVIPPEKHYLIRQRLEDLARNYGGGTFGGLADKLAQDQIGHLRDQVIEAITTNETSFFRDQHPFDTLREYVLPILFDRLSEARVRSPAHPSGPIRIWCCGSSTGQEPYSLAMTLARFARANKFRGSDPTDFQIVATDISQPAINRGKTGVYSEFEISRGLPDEMKRQYFEKTGNQWSVKKDIRRLISWMKLNLLDAFTLLGSFQIILCRNVLIYFDEETKKQIVEKYHRMLETGGFLMLGSTELLMDHGDRFKSIRRGSTILYQKTG